MTVKDGKKLFDTMTSKMVNNECPLGSDDKKPVNLGKSQYLTGYIQSFWVLKPSTNFPIPRNFHYLNDFHLIAK
jgi:hypothetical protein